MANKNLYAHELAKCSIHYSVLSSEMYALSIANNDSEASRKSYFYKKISDKFKKITFIVLDKNRNRFWTEKLTEGLYVHISLQNQELIDNKISLNKFPCNLEESETDIKFFVDQSD